MSGTVIPSFLALCVCAPLAAAQSTDQPAEPAGRSDRQPHAPIERSECEPRWVNTFGGDPNPRFPLGLATVVLDGERSLAVSAEFYPDSGTFPQPAFGVKMLDRGDWRSISGPSTYNVAPIQAVLFDDGDGPTNFILWDPYGGFSDIGVGRWSGGDLVGAYDGLNVLGSDFSSLAIFDSGAGPELYAAGSFTPLGGTAKYPLVKRVDGVWTPVGQPSDARISDIAVYEDADGRHLYAAGGFTTQQGMPSNHVARWNGTQWLAAPNAGVDDPANRLAVIDDGPAAGLYAIAFQLGAGMHPLRLVLRLDGQQWLPVGSGAGGGNINDVVAYDGRLYITGRFESVDGIPASGIAAWDGQAWSTPGGGLQSNRDPIGHALHVFDHGSGPELHVAGQFLSIGGEAIPRLARWNGQRWAHIPAGLDSRVAVLEAFDGAVYAGGSFAQALGVELNAIGRWSPAEGWSPLGQGVDGQVRAMAVYDDGDGPALYVGGEFAHAGGQAASNIARWDGQSWSALGAGVDGGVETLKVFDDGAGPSLFVGGHFQNAGGQPASRVARWSAGGWSAVGQGASVGVYALEVFDDGAGPALYIGGGEEAPGAAMVAKWDGTGWSPLGSGVDGRIVHALHAFDDGSGPALYVAGRPNNFAGPVISLMNIVRWDGQSWSAVGETFTAGLDVFELGDFDDGSGPALYAGGQFTNYALSQFNHLARWDGSVWSSMGVNRRGVSSVRTILPFDAGDGPALLVGGWFASMPQPAIGDSNLALYQGCPPACIPDLNADGVVDADDFFLFLQLFAAGDPRADINNDGVIDADDFFAFLTLFAAGC